MKSLPTYEELQQPLPVFSFKNIYYRLLRLFLYTVGNLSDGIRTGNTYGHDSGVMLDYVYKNHASGRFGIGVLIDRVYLNAVGWQGIRLRKQLLTACLARTLRSRLQTQTRVRYLDIACGGGEYDLEALQQVEAPRVEAELRDYKAENIERARQNAPAGLQTVHFRQADAFDRSNYQEKWDIIVSSGFWEIITDDGLVRDCLMNVAECLNPGGSLIFTIQPYHPQLEMAARSLTSNTGKPWIMRLRSLGLFKAWLNEAGLEYVSSEMEENGIFGVVEARKR